MVAARNSLHPSRGLSVQGAASTDPSGALRVLGGVSPVFFCCLTNENHSHWSVRVRKSILEPGEL